MIRSAQGPRDTPNLYRAEVVDNKDPERYFRVKLKIFGVTDEGTTKDSSVWAEVIQGNTPGIDGSIGISSVLQVGTMVWCMLENNDPNKPVVIGVLSGKDDVSDALAGDKYIDAQSLYTKSGHKIVIDDSQGDEFIYVFHRTGSYIKIDHNGDIFVNGVRDCQFDIARDTTWNIGRHLTVNVEGNETVNIKGTSTWAVDGDRTTTFKSNETNTTNGNQTNSIDGNVSAKIGGSESMNVGGSATKSVGGSTSHSTSSLSVQSPTSSFSGNVSIGGNLSGGVGRARGGGNATFTGTVIASNDCIGGGISLKGHTHGVINHSKTTPPN